MQGLGTQTNSVNMERQTNSVDMERRYVGCQTQQSAPQPATAIDKRKHVRHMHKHLHSLQFVCRAGGDHTLMYIFLIQYNQKTSLVQSKRYHTGYQKCCASRQPTTSISSISTKLQKVSHWLTMQHFQHNELMQCQSRALKKPAAFRAQPPPPAPSAGRPGGCGPSSADRSACSPSACYGTPTAEGTCSRP